MFSRKISNLKKYRFTFQSKNGKEVTLTLGLENIKTEISKIKRLLRSADDHKLLNEIESILNDLKMQSKIEMSSEYSTESLNDEALDKNSEIM